MLPRPAELSQSSGCATPLALIWMVPQKGVAVITGRVCSAGAKVAL